ncbi:MAG: electron transfer flavoprotein subunit beta/FixA family protein [Candidatus Delongbacteria bacterium]|nr:electron transfer flavoprotein subunit beta/FixA family protein [Candidatus Delongbacteria bacterium]
MKAIVCMKQVPDTESRITINPEKTGVEQGDFSYIIGPYDEYAIEAALQLKEAAGEGEVVLLSVGDPSIKSTLQKGMAMGADRSVLIEVDSYNGDALTTARLLAAQLKTMEYDIIFFGKQAPDDNNAQVGPMVGQLLGLPTVTAIAALEVQEGKAVVEREVEGGREVYEVTLPALLTTEKGLNEPRYPSLKGIMQAKRKPVDLVSGEVAAATTEQLTWSYPPSRAEGKIVGEGTAAVPELVRLLKEEAKVL